MSRPLVVVIDDDRSVRESLPDLLRELGFEARPFASPEEFLRSGYVERADVLLLDVAMPGMNGPNLQQALMTGGTPTPIVFITAQADTLLRARLVATGAVACLFKPFTDAALLASLRAAVRAR